MTVFRYIAGALAALVLSSVCLSGLQAANVEVMDDFDFGSWSPLMSRWKKTVPICVWDESVAQTNFNVVASGLNDARRFRLKSSVNNTIGYRVYWRDGRNTTSRERLTSNVASDVTYSSNDANRCQAGPSGYMEVVINRKALNEAAPGIYSDTLMLMISAQ